MRQADRPLRTVNWTWLIHWVMIKVKMHVEGLERTHICSRKSAIVTSHGATMLSWWLEIGRTWIFNHKNSRDHLTSESSSESNHRSRRNARRKRCYDVFCLVTVGARFHVILPPLIWTSTGDRHDGFTCSLVVCVVTVWYSRGTSSCARPPSGRHVRTYVFHESALISVKNWIFLATNTWADKTQSIDAFSVAIAFRGS